MKITVSVTQDDIDDGERMHCTRCPVALALRRALPNAGGIAVGDDDIEFSPEGAESSPIVVELPWAPWEFVAAFDEGDHVAPFAFDLELPDSIPA